MLTPFSTPSMLKSLSMFVSFCTECPKIIFSSCETQSFCTSMLLHLVFNLSGILTLIRVYLKGRSGAFRRHLNNFGPFYAIGYLITLLIYVLNFITDFDFFDASRYLKDDSCDPFFSFWWTFAYLTYILALLMIVSIAIICYTYKYYRDKVVDSKISEEAKLAFEKLHFGVENIEQFYQKHRDCINKYGLFHPELIIYKDLFEVEYRTLQAIDANRANSHCLICHEKKLEEKDRVVPFPGCGHIYHYRCIGHWLAGNPSCPTCHSDFRKAFVQEIKAKHIVSFVKVTY